MTGMKIIRFFKHNSDFFNVIFFDVIFKLLSAIISILLVRIMSKNSYSDFTVFSSILSMLCGVVGTGLGLLYVRRTTEIVSAGIEDKSGLYFQCLLVILIITITICLFANRIISSFYGISSALSLYACIYSGILSICTLNVNRFQAYEQYRKGGWLNILRNLIIVALLFLLLSANYDVDSEKAIRVYMFAGSVSGFVGVIIILRNETISLKNMEIIPLVSEMAMLFIYYILVNINSAIDIALLKRMSTNDAVADYGIAYKYYTLLISILPSITAVFKVRTSKIEYTENPTNRIKFIKNWIKKTSICLIPIAMISQFLIKPVMNLLNGVQYSNSINSFRVFFLGAICSYILSPGVSFLISSKRYIIMCLLALVAIIANIIGNYLMIPVIGVMGATISTVVSTFIINFGSNLIEYILDSKQ